MDLIVGHLERDGFSTCVFAEDYNSCIKADRRFANIAGDEIRVLAVFLNKGSLAKEIHDALQGHIKCQTVGWYDASPGQITDIVHYLTCPNSIVNNFSRSIDDYLALAPLQSDVPAVPAKKAKPAKPNDGKPRVRTRRGEQPLHSV